MKSFKNLIVFVILVIMGWLSGSVADPVCAVHRIAFVGDLFVTYPAFCKQHFYASSWEQIDSRALKMLRYTFVMAVAGHRGITADRQLIEKLGTFRLP